MHGNMYGTSVAAVEEVVKGGKVCVLDLDVQGVKSLKAIKEGGGSEIFEGTKFVFIAPPDIETLEKRLVNRGSESEETLRMRLGNAAEEMEYGLEGGNFDEVVINDSVERATEDLVRVIEKMYPDVVRTT